MVTRTIAIVGIAVAGLGVALLAAPGAGAQDTEGWAAAGEWYDRAEPTYAALVDVQHRVSSLYNLVNVPSAVWVDEQGQVVRINEGTYTQTYNFGDLEFGKIWST